MLRVLDVNEIELVSGGLQRNGDVLRIRFEGGNENFVSGTSVTASINSSFGFSFNNGFGLRSSANASVGENVAEFNSALTGTLLNQGLLQPVQPPPPTTTTPPTMGDTLLDSFTCGLSGECSEENQRIRDGF